MMRRFLLLLSLGALLSCDARRENGKIVVEMDTSGAEEKAREAGREIRAGAQAAGQAAQAASGALQAGKQEFDIRTAFAMRDDLDRTNIGVIANDATHSVKLMGSVPTVAQRDLALSIAREKAKGWTIVDELRIAPPPPAPPAAPPSATAP